MAKMELLCLQCFLMVTINTPPKTCLFSKTSFGKIRGPRDYNNLFPKLAKECSIEVSYSLRCVCLVKIDMTAIVAPVFSPIVLTPYPRFDTPPMFEIITFFFDHISKF